MWRILRRGEAAALLVALVVLIDSEISRSKSMELLLYTLGSVSVSESGRFRLRSIARDEEEEEEEEDDDDV